MRSFKIKSSLALFCLFFQVEALAYTLKCNDANTSCKVYCENNNLAGEMFWNGSKWSDGVRANINKNVLAKEIVKVQGTECR